VRLAFALARARLGAAFTCSRSTCADVSTAVPEEASPSAPALNHSRMLAASPGEIVDMWFFTLSWGIPSAQHFSTIALDLTPSSFASSNTRVDKSHSNRAPAAGAVLIPPSALIRLRPPAHRRHPAPGQAWTPLREWPPRPDL